MATVINIDNPDLPAPTGRKRLAQTSENPKAKNRKNRGANEGKQGRPLKEIDWGQLEKMANIFLKVQDMAYLAGVSVDTLERACKKTHSCTFAVWWKGKAARGKMSLHRALMSEAIGLEHDGYVREPNGSIARDPEGWPLEDKRKQRRPNGLILMYLAKHVLDIEGTAYPYDPEEQYGANAEDDREGTDTVYPIYFVGDDADEVDEQAAPGLDADEAEEAEEYYPDSTGLTPYKPNGAANPYDYDEPNDYADNE